MSDTPFNLFQPLQSTAPQGATGFQNPMQAMESGNQLGTTLMNNALKAKQNDLALEQQQKAKANEKRALLLARKIAAGPYIGRAEDMAEYALIANPNGFKQLQDAEQQMTVEQNQKLLMSAGTLIARLNSGDLEGAKAYLAQERQAAMEGDDKQALKLINDAEQVIASNKDRPQDAALQLRYAFSGIKGFTEMAKSWDAKEVSESKADLNKSLTLLNGIKGGTEEAKAVLATAKAEESKAKGRLILAEEAYKQAQTLYLPDDARLKQAKANREDALAASESWKRTLMEAETLAKQNQAELIKRQWTTEDKKAGLVEAQTLTQATLQELNRGKTKEVFSTIDLNNAKRLLTDEQAKTQMTVQELNRSKALLNAALGRKADRWVSGTGTGTNGTAGAAVTGGNTATDIESNLATVNSSVNRFEQLLAEGKDLPAGGDIGNIKTWFSNTFDRYGGVAQWQAVTKQALTGSVLEKLKLLRPASDTDVKFIKEAVGNVENDPLTAMNAVAMQKQLLEYYQKVVDAMKSAPTAKQKLKSGQVETDQQYLDRVVPYPKFNQRTYDIKEGKGFLGTGIGKEISWVKNGQPIAMKGNDPEWVASGKPVNPVATKP